jgi:ribosome-binding factor A
MTRKTASGAPTQRQLRVGEELRHALAELLRRGDFHDPALQSLNVTVTEVRISPDLRNATAFVTPLGGGEIGGTVAALRRAAPYLRSLLAQSVRLRLAPRLSFEADVSFDQAYRIERLLHSPEVARDLSAAGEAGPAADPQADAPQPDDDVPHDQ